MLQWLNTLSVDDVTAVDVAGVRTSTTGSRASGRPGHMVLATSGSSGKCSFLNQTRGDDRAEEAPLPPQRRLAAGARRARTPAGAGRCSGSGRSRAPTARSPRPTSMPRTGAGPGATFALGVEPLRIADVSRMAAMRKKLADGSAHAAGDRRVRSRGRRQGRRRAAAMLKLADTILDHRHEPMMLSGLWAQFLTLIARARERGIGDGEFHPKASSRAAAA
jgi:hypothetical protein